MRESQYIDGYLATAAEPATRWTPWTFLKYRVHGSAWSSWSHSYYDALMRAISRRVEAGTVIGVPSKGGGTAYIPVLTQAQVDEAYAWADRFMRDHVKQEERS